MSNQDSQSAESRGQLDVADGRQLILPHVDTSLDVADGRLPFKFTLPMLFISFPGFIFFVASGWLFITGNAVGSILLLTAAMAFAFTAVVAHYTSTQTMWPHERVLSTGRYLTRKLTMPWNHDQAVANADKLHGVKEIIEVETDSREGTFAGVLSHDGRAVVPIRLNGSNTEYLEQQELTATAMSFMKGFDSEISSDGEPVGIYSTTRPWETPVAESYLERTAELTDRNRLTPYLSGLLGDIGEWIREEDDNERANEVHHFLVVSAREGTNDDALPGAIKRRVKQAVNCANRSRHITPEPVSAHDVINLAAEYWQSGTFPDSETGESASRAAAPPVNVDKVQNRERPEGSTPAERMLSPNHISEKTDTMEVGDAYARTYWISAWPQHPKIRFFHDIWMMRDIDLDTKFFAHPRDREKTTKSVEVDGAQIDSEGMDKSEEGRVDTIKIDDDLDAYLLFYSLLQNSNTKPWSLSGYVTVRSHDKDKLQTACERIEREMRDAPARLTPKVPHGDQLRAFRSVAPFGDDYYAGLGEKRYRATKTHLALGGAFGALLPAASATLTEKGGARWGRDAATGRMIQVDQFNQSTAGHTITIGPSGGGKTVFAESVSQELCMASDDLTFIACDTQGGFEDLNEAFDAEHIVIDGKTGINPFDIRPAPSHESEATKGQHDQHRMKVSDCVDFFAGILRSNGIDPADYRALLEQAIQKTFADAGITSDPETHSLPSPEPEEFFYVLKDMAENTEDYTFAGIDMETEKMKDRLADLLIELSGFKPGGKYHHLLSDTADGISPDSDMVYIDMRQLAGRKDGGKSVNLQLAVSQISQLIRQTGGRTIFMVDEAHNFLHSPELIDWLNKAAREWRRYNAVLWLITQSPREFVEQQQGEAAGVENKRLELMEQCSVKHIFDSGGVDADVLEKFGVPREHASVAQDELVGGNSEMDYTQCLMSFHDEPGWFKTTVKVNPIHLSSITFAHKHGWSYRERMLAALNNDFGDVGLPSDEDDAHEEIRNVVNRMGVAADGGEVNHE